MCLDADVAKAFLVASSILAAIDFAACCLAVAIIALKRSYRARPLRVLLYLSVVGLLCSVTAGLQVVPADIVTARGGRGNGYVAIRPEYGWEAACRAFGFLSNYFFLCKVSLTFVLCADVFVTKCLRKEFTVTARWEVAGLVSSLFLPLALFSWLPFIKNSYGLSGTWCSIKDGCNNVTSLGRDLAIGASVVPNLALYALSAALVACVVTVGCSNALCRCFRLASFETFASDLVLLLYPILLCAGYCVAMYTTVNDNDGPSGFGLMALAAFTHVANILLPVIAFCNQRNSSSSLVQSWQIEYESAHETSSVKESSADAEWTHEDQSLLVKKSLP